MNWTAYLPLIIQFIVPALVGLYGARFMAKSGMLPAQARLEGVLKDTITALQRRSETLEDDLQEARDALSAARGIQAQQEETFKAMESAYKSRLNDTEASIKQMKAALSSAQSQSQDMRHVLDHTDEKIINSQASAASVSERIKDTPHDATTP